MTEDQLDKLSIFQLRELARRMGVFSPTSKRKGELIESIMDISNGNASPHFSKTKQGRPPKNAGFNFVDVLMPETTSQPFVLSQGDFGKISQVEGVVEISNGLNGFVWQFKDNRYNCIFLPAKLISEYNLKMGDKICGKVMYKDGQLSVSQLTKINGGRLARQLNVPAYDAIKHDVNTQKIEMDGINLDVKHGENCYFVGDNNNTNTTHLIDVLNACKADRKIYINCSIAAKNEGYLDAINNDTDLFVSRITDTEETAKKIIALACAYAKRGLESKQKVIIAVDDIFGVMSVCADDELVAGNLLSLTKNGENGGAITILAVYKDDKYSKRYEKLADHIIDFKNIK